MRLINLRLVQRLALAVFLGAVIFSTGCGGKKGSVKGVATYQQSPVGGTVVFVNDAGKEYEGPLTPKGEYFINAPKGKYQIYFKKSATVGLVTGGGMVGPDGKPLGEGMPGSVGSSKPAVHPPDKYLDKAKSGLTIEVTGGEQDHPLTLTDS